MLAALSPKARDSLQCMPKLALTFGIPAENLDAGRLSGGADPGHDGVAMAA